MKGADKFKPDEREQAISDHLDYIKGASDLGSIYDALPKEGDAFATMKTDLKERLQTATATDRAKLHFDLALYRSLRYAVASSKFCLVLGSVNGIRELYEGQRLTDPLYNP